MTTTTPTSGPTTPAHSGARRLKCRGTALPAPSIGEKLDPTTLGHCQRGTIFTPSEISATAGSSCHRAIPTPRRWTTWGPTDSAGNPQGYDASAPGFIFSSGLHRFYYNEVGFTIANAGTTIRDLLFDFEIQIRPAEWRTGDLLTLTIETTGGGLSQHVFTWESADWRRSGYFRGRDHLPAARRPHVAKFTVLSPIAAGCGRPASADVAAHRGR